MNKKFSGWEIILIILQIIAILIPTYFFFITSPEEIKNQTIIIFIGTAIILFIGTAIFYFYSRWKMLINNVKENKNEIDIIKKDINTEKLNNDMNVRLKVIEHLLKNKRGQIIDPRIIFVIIILILLYLFLKSIGIFG